MFLKRLKIWFLAIVASAIPIGSVFAQSGWQPIEKYRRTMPNAVAVASYKFIGINEFRRLVIGAFEASGFSFLRIVEKKGEASNYRFSYPVPKGGTIDVVFLELAVDENADRNNRCATCFLRRMALPNLLEVKDSSWMIQYDLNDGIYKDIDHAFEKIHVDGMRYMDESVGFNYRELWREDQNVLDNSFVSISPQSLKSMAVDAYQTAGFIFTGEKPRSPDSSSLELGFIFPLDAGRVGGAEYKIVFFSQLDKAGECFPCEMGESFDPHQKLPPAGWAGMAERLTLESRFTAARALAFEELRSATKQYLRPRSVFTVPPKPAPLGSPRPLIPVAVT